MQLLLKHFCHASTLAVILALTIPVHAQDTSFGQRVYQDKADCKFCHGPEADGRGDPRSPGAAPSLRITVLTKPQVIEVIACGRPGTEMPHFDKYAYDDDTPCYGMKEKQVGKDKPPDPHSTPLTRREIEAVAEYLFATIVGK